MREALIYRIVKLKYLSLSLVAEGAFKEEKEKKRAKETIKVITKKGKITMLNMQSEEGNNYFLRFC